MAARGDQRGPKNPNWRGGINSLRKTKGQCEVCGRQTRNQLSTLCARCARLGSANPNWENFRSISPDAGRQRARKRIKELGPCERCGRPAHDRHHVDDDQLNNAPDNIRVLCRRCHMIEDGRLEALRERNRQALPRRI
jgi:predicted amidophosphoribosyltransferase